MKMLSKDQTGIAHLVVVLVVVVVLAIGAVAWRVWDGQNNKATPATVDTSAQQKTNEDTTKPDPNAGYLVLKEWGLRFKTPAGITDVKYVIHGETTAFYAKPSGSSVQYRSGYDKFDEYNNPSYAIGTLYRKTEAKNVNTALDIITEGKKVGDYYYYTGWSFSSLATGRGCVGLYSDSDGDCETESGVFKLVNQGDTALLNTIELAQ